MTAEGLRGRVSLELGNILIASQKSVTGRVQKNTNKNWIYFISAVLICRVCVGNVAVAAGL